jgi:hypothetical protein
MLADLKAEPVEDPRAAAKNGGVSNVEQRDLTRITLQ